MDFGIPTPELYDYTTSHGVVDIHRPGNKFFIAHDLAVVEHISDRIAVMTNGKIVETGNAEEVCANPQHEYTKKLIAAVPTFL